ncbi:DUF4239 domain-containing protein [Microbacterium sp. ABRD28]|uniref:bestrophin-like domain n=1 Tax=Microbacterium sp. ABRD28 TaxID=2268461 RepID=UPI001F0BF814|nr:DUF4239 domain-containing protein [Microbacterium sp. ABRD28]
MWLYQLPVGVALPGFVILFVAASLLIVIALRRWVPGDKKQMREWDRILAYVMATFGVLYGVTLALIAAASYENYRGVEEIVRDEASAVAVLYRDTAGFPEPERGELQALIVSYVDHVREVDWEAQREGRIPSQSVAEVAAIEDVLFSFEPEGEGEANVHAAAIWSFNEFMSARSARIGVIGLELPGILWFVLYSGAAITAVLIGMIQMGRLRTHLVMAAVLASYVAIVIFTIASFDHPYMGPVAVDTEYFEEVQEWLFDRAD